MNLRFTSTLTPEDENAMAPAVMKALASILDLVPIAYMLRIDTSDCKVYEHTGQGAPQPGAADMLPATALRGLPFES